MCVAMPFPLKKPWALFIACVHYKSPCSFLWSIIHATEFGLMFFCVLNLHGFIFTGRPSHQHSLFRPVIADKFANPASLTQAVNPYLPANVAQVTAFFRHHWKYSFLSSLILIGWTRLSFNQINGPLRLNSGAACSTVIFSEYSSGNE